MAKASKRNVINRYEDHSFYCMNCGKKGIPIWRDKSKLHSKDHRKVLYCPFCRETVNHVEVRNFEEKEKFLQNFEAGNFKEEAAASIAFVKNQVIKF